MDHVAFDVDPDRIDGYVAALRDAGVDCTEVANHDDSEFGIAAENHDGVFVRSIYFLDPDGILLELAAWTRPMRPDDVAHEPVRLSAAEAV
jgi:catechol 2,3-dioxygenase-like lactoylglutathione lyase family enzyme